MKITIVHHYGTSDKNCVRDCYQVEIFISGVLQRLFEDFMCIKYANYWVEGFREGHPYKSNVEYVEVSDIEGVD